MYIFFSILFAGVLSADLKAHVYISTCSHGGSSSSNAKLCVKGSESWWAIPGVSYSEAYWDTPWKCRNGPFKKGYYYTFNLGPSKATTDSNHKVRNLGFHFSGTTDGIAVGRMRTSGFGNNWDERTFMNFPKDKCIAPNPVPNGQVGGCDTLDIFNRATLCYPRICEWFWLDTQNSKIDHDVGLVGNSIHGYGTGASVCGLIGPHP